MQVPQPGSENRLLSRDAFAAYMQQQIADQADIPTLHYADMVLTLHIYGAPVRVELEPFYADYQQQPDQLELLTESLLKSVHNYKPDYLMTDLARLSPHIYPMLKPFDLLAVVRERHLPMLAYQPFLANLMISYVIDEQDSVTYINERHLQNWQADLAVVHACAMDNLRRRTAQTDYRVMGRGAQRLLLYVSQDGYDATRLLLPELLHTWASMVPGQMVIGVPNRDFLLAFSNRDQQIFTTIVRQIQIDTVQHTAGLTDQLFTLVNGELQIYVWE